MSLYDYQESRKLSGHSFDTLMFAAMRKADDVNCERLKIGWPELWAELFERYNSPGGIIKGEEYAD